MIFKYLNQVLTNPNSIVIMNLYTTTNKIFRALGLELRRYPSRLMRNRKSLFDNFDIDLLFDVGANVGQYGKLTRAIGYQGEIYSFEPLKEAFAKLSNEARNDSKWHLTNCGLGSKQEELTINIASNSASSSILPMNQSHLEAAPTIAYVNKEKIRVNTLDSFIKEKNIDLNRNIFLKIDTQGFEMEVLRGAENSLKNIKGVQLEMSLFTMYDGEALYDEMIAYLKERGFQLFSLEPGLSNHKTGQLLQVDGIFFKD